MKVSVILPTYKPEDYIYECLDSLNNQSLSKDSFEIIIVLNGCGQPWLDNLNNYIHTHTENLNIKLLNIEEGGVSNARNIGLDCSEGEYITFMDDDDYVSPDYLKELYETADVDTISLSDAIAFKDKTHEQDLSYAQHTVFERLNNKKNLSLLKSRKMFNGPVMKLIHRSIIGDRRFEKQFANGEDSLYMFLISDRIKKVKFTSPKAVYYRRIRCNSATTKKKSRLDIAINRFKMCLFYTKYYVSNPFHYNLPFLLSRYAAATKTLLYGK